MLDEVLKGLGGAVGLALAGFLIALAHQQIARIKDERIRNAADNIVSAMELELPAAGMGAKKKAAATALLKGNLKDAAYFLSDPKVDGHELVIEAAVHRMKVMESK